MSYSFDDYQGHLDGMLREAYQQGRTDAIAEMEKAMHDAYRGTSHDWESKVFDLIAKHIKEQKNE